jgi:hypothetical protein
MSGVLALVPPPPDPPPWPPIPQAPLWFRIQNQAGRRFYAFLSWLAPLIATRRAREAAWRDGFTEGIGQPAPGAGWMSGHLAEWDEGLTAGYAALDALPRIGRGHYGSPGVPRLNRRERAQSAWRLRSPAWRKLDALERSITAVIEVLGEHLERPAPRRPS